MRTSQILLCWAIPRCHQFGRKKAVGFTVKWLGETSTLIHFYDNLFWSHQFLSKLEMRDKLQTWYCIFLKCRALSCSSLFFVFLSSMSYTAFLTLTRRCLNALDLFGSASLWRPPRPLPPSGCTPSVTLVATSTTILVPSEMRQQVHWESDISKIYS